MHFAPGHGAITCGIYIRSFSWKKRTTKNVRASTFLWGRAIFYVGCQDLFVFMLCNVANLLCINPGLVKTCYSRRPFAMCCVNLGKSSLFGNLEHKLGDGILSQGLVLVPTLCRLWKRASQSGWSLPNINSSDEMGSIDEPGIPYILTSV